MIRGALALLLLLSAPVLAGGLPVSGAGAPLTRRATDLKVRETVVVDVGGRRGIIATDEASNTNRVTLKGLKPGRTQCRAGDIKGQVPPLVMDVFVNG